MLIKKLSYKFAEVDELIQLEIKNQSGTFKETSQPVRQGTSNVSEAAAYVSGISTDLDNQLKKIVALGAIFVCEDLTGTTYTIGTDEIKAALSLDKKNEGKAGSLYGYDLKITWNSASGATVESFQSE